MVLALNNFRSLHRRLLLPGLQCAVKSNVDSEQELISSEDRRTDFRHEDVYEESDEDIASSNEELDDSSEGLWYLSV